MASMQAIKIVALAVGTSLLSLSGQVVQHSEEWMTALQQAIDVSRRGDYGQALERYSALLSTELIKSNVELHSYVLSQMADANIELGSHSEAVAGAQEALNLLMRDHKTDSNAFAIAEGVLAAAFRAEGNYDAAKKAGEHAVALGKRTLGPFAPRLGILVTTLGQIRQETGDLKGAQRLCQQAIEIFEHAGSANLVELGGAYQNLAVVYSLRGKPREALAAVELSLTILKRALPPDHPFIAYALSTKLAAYIRLKLFQEAEGVIPELNRQSGTNSGMTQAARVIVLNNMAAVYLTEKKYRQGEPFLREAMEVSGAHFPPGHPLVRDTLLNYCHLLEQMNRKDEAAHYRAQANVLLAFPQRQMNRWHANF